MTDLSEEKLRKLPLPELMRLRILLNRGLTSEEGMQTFVRGVRGILPTAPEEMIEQTMREAMALIDDLIKGFPNKET